MPTVSAGAPLPPEFASLLPPSGAPPRAKPPAIDPSLLALLPRKYGGTASNPGVSNPQIGAPPTATANASQPDWVTQWQQMQRGKPAAPAAASAADASDWAAQWQQIQARDARARSGSGAGSLPPEMLALLPRQYGGTAPDPNTPSTPAQRAAALWAKTPAWQKPLLFVSQGINDVGTGIDRLLGIPTTGPIPQAHRDRFAAPPDQQAAPAVWNALDQQHPGYNALVKWPTELGMSAPLGEGAGALVSKALPKLPAGASLLTRMLARVPAAAARGAAYGVQQPGGSPGTNAAVGAVTGPLFEGGAALGGKVLGLTAQGAQGLMRKFFPQELTQPQLDSVLARRFAERGLPTTVTPRQTAPGVELTTAVHSGDPRLMALQAAERISGNGTPFYEAAGANNAAIVNGLQQRFAPQADNSAISSAAHDLLQSAQGRGRAAVRAAYAPFDAIKGGVYLDREPIENALREAYNGLLPTHREILPAKVQEIIGRAQPVERQIAPGSPQQMLDAARPLHLTNDVEDLGARLSDAIAGAKPGSPAARALMTMRDALNRGVEASHPVAGVTGGEPIEDATGLWTQAKAANTAFRSQFPQGTARDTESRQWLSRWLSGRKDSSRFLTEAMVSPARAQTVLDALKDSPAEQAQMRGLLQNGYVNRLLSATREGIPGTRTLNADALTRARTNNAALERVLLNPSERGTLDRYVQAAHDNQAILQRLHTGSSETVALTNYGKENDSSVMEELLKHGASAMHPAVGFVAHLLPALAKSPDNEAALQRTLVSALLNPDVYNRVAGAPQQIQSPVEKLLTGLAQPARMALTRPAVVGTSRMLGPALSPPPAMALARQGAPSPVAMPPRLLASRGPMEDHLYRLRHVSASRGGQPALPGAQ